MGDYRKRHPRSWGAHGMSAVTAVTAQHTQAVEAVHPVPADVVQAQIRAVAGDIEVDAVKTAAMEVGR